MNSRFSSFANSIRPALPLVDRLSPAMWQAAMLFAVDMVTNVTDYGFHVYLGQALPPGDFAVVQTVNAVLLVVITTFAVMQPVVARYVAEAAAGAAGAAQGRAIFQLYWRQSAWLGVALTGLAWLGQRPLAAWLNIPTTAVSLSALMLFISMVRPVVAGMLQGRQQFVAFGLTRTTYAIGRLLVAVLLISVAGSGATGGVAAMPLGGFLALAAGLLLLGRGVWRPGPSLPRSLVGQGWRLSLGALGAYGAYMTLLSADLIWVNRLFAPALAGSYATAVVLRRVLAVLPGAVLVILYPRVVATIAAGRLPDRLLLKTAAAMTAANVAATLLYFVLGEPLVALVFGPNYPAAAPLLGWMGVAMTGYGLAAIWLNLFLATRPWPFVALLGATAVLQMALLSVAVATLAGVTAVFMLGGWITAAGGLLLYLLWLRPSLKDSA